MFNTILAAYGLDAALCQVMPFGTGLINNTWRVNTGRDEFILQKINKNVFKVPPAIAENMRMIGEHLRINAPGYLFVMPISTLAGEDLVFHEQEYFRLMPFIRRSRTYVVASNTQIAREAAVQFGCFTRKLAGFDASRLKITLADFHDLTLRYRQFESSLKSGDRSRIESCAAEVKFVKQHKGIVDVYEKIILDPEFKKRVTHHDTKISNVLFDDLDNGLCVIDMDTTMSGYFISDVGDMMRTYLCPLSEEERDYSKLQVRDDYFTAIASGYLQEMKQELTSAELDHFVYSGEFMIYMQAVRFLADYFNNDVYYGSKYEGHNLVRARNQMELLQLYLDKSNIFKKEVLALASSMAK
jgi:Ser/Thr protein kinase RdoA (MazF antagonist)